MVTFIEKCKQPGCDRIVYMGGAGDGIHCWNHARQAYREAREATEGKVTYAAQCQFGKGIRQCTNPARAGGLCTKHYQRQRKSEKREEAQGLE